ncbi:MAG: hypothetical protein ABUL60_00320 [Myxococcales bacterium]
MGWSRLASGSLAVVLGALFTCEGCGGSDSSTPSAAGAGASATSGGSSGASAGSSGASAGSSGASAGSGGSALSAAGHASGGSAVEGGVGAGGSSGEGGPETINIYVDQVRGREGCLPRPLPVVEAAADGFEAGQVHCQLAVVAEPGAGGACTCAAADHLKAASASLEAAVLKQAQATGSCGGDSGLDCQSLCVCELEQCSGAALTQCQTDATPVADLPPGFCYVDATVVPPVGSATLVASCPQSSRRELRILGPVPDPAPLLFVGCFGLP